MSKSISPLAGGLRWIFREDTSLGKITVADTNKLDYETTSSYALTVGITDNGISVGSDNATITINVGDLNESPVVSDQTFNVDENSPVGTSVGTVVMTDDDTGQSHTFTITAGNEDGAFAINASTGELTVADAILDYEETTTYSLTVDVSDDGTPPLSDTATITIDINNLGERAVRNAFVVADGDLTAQWTPSSGTDHFVLLDDPERQPTVPGPDGVSTFFMPPPDNGQ